MLDKLKWTRDACCQVCERKLPDGYDGYIGTGPGLHVVVVTWMVDGERRADGAVTHMWQGTVRRLMPEEAVDVALAAIQAVEAGRTHDNARS